MSNTKQEIILKQLEKKIKAEEKKLYQIEELIQKEKSFLGSIIANNQAAAHPILRISRIISAGLIGMSLPYAFANNFLLAGITLLGSAITFMIYTLGTGFDKHDKIWRKRCLNHIEQLKDEAKKCKRELGTLYTKAKELEQLGTITKDPILEEEIKKELRKPSYQRERMQEQAIIKESAKEPTR